MQEAQGGYSGGSLLLAAAGSCLLGIGLGYHVAKRELAVVAGKGAAPRNGRAVPRLHLGGGANGGGYGSLDSTPSATPRSLSRSDIAAGSGLRMVLLMRTDVPLSKQEVAEQASRTVLGMFKKQYKRRDPNLRGWEEGGHQMKVLGVSSQDDMLLQQAAARALAIPTHTFAERLNRQRNLMAIGPAPAEQLEQIMLHLQELS